MGCLSPWVVIVIVAIIGACVGGPIGFLVFGVLGFIGVTIFGLVLRKTQGGTLPRRVRDEVVTDFMTRHGEAVASAYPNDSGYERKRKLEALFEEMVARAVRTSGSNNPDVSLHFSNFLPVAEQVVEEQPSTESHQLAAAFVEFLKHHPQWYGDTFGV